MPELADVEGMRRYFRRHAADRDIRGVAAPAPEVIRNSTPAALGRALAGRRFAAPRRRGKWLIAPLDGDDDRAVVLHFGMDGGLHWRTDAADRSAHDRVVFTLDGGELRYRTARKLGGVWLARGMEELEAIHGSLGPEAGGLNEDALRAILHQSRARVKTLLMDQERIAGLGNEMTDEILWRAGLHPETRTNRLGDREVSRLHEALREVVRASRRHGRIPFATDWLRPRREERDPRCPSCGRPLRRSQVGGRKTYWCARHQPPPRA